MSDPQKYRTKDELEEYKERSPIDHVLKVLKDQYKITDAEVDIIIERVSTRSGGIGEVCRRKASYLVTTNS